MADDLRTRPCDLCGKPAGEVINYDPSAVRVGWLCVECWPDPAAFVRAVNRERVVKK